MLGRSKQQLEPGPPRPSKSPILLLRNSEGPGKDGSKRRRLFTTAIAISYPTNYQPVSLRFRPAPPRKKIPIEAHPRGTLRQKVVISMHSCSRRVVQSESYDSPLISVAACRPKKTTTKQLSACKLERQANYGLSSGLLAALKQLHQLQLPRKTSTRACVTSVPGRIFLRERTMNEKKRKKELYRRVHRIVYEPTWRENRTKSLMRYIRHPLVPADCKVLADKLLPKMPRHLNLGLFEMFMEWFGSTFCRRHNHVETIVRGNRLPLWHCPGPRLGLRSLTY